MRHAKSDWSVEGRKDIERPLNARGQKDAPKVGSFLKETGNMPDLILASPALRVAETLEGIQGAWDEQPEVSWVEELYSSGFRSYLEVIQKQGGAADTLLVIGHNPTVEETAAMICAGANASNVFRFPTAAVACFEVPEIPWQRFKRGSGELKWFITPKLIKTL